MRTKAALDYETRTSYTVIARVEDPRGLSDAITVTVAVTNVGLSGIAGQYDRDDNETIDRDEVLAAVADYFRGAIDGEETLAIIRLYFAGLEGGGAPSNRSPSFSEGDETSRSMAENTAAGQGIGEPLEAVDSDRGDTLTYTLEGEDAGSFDIDAATGQLRTKAALDYETRTSYTVIARVEDPRGLSDAITVTVAVTNVGLSGIAGQYDRDDNETIDRDEVLAAVADYFRGAIDREETLAIIRLYFADE